MWPCLSQQPWHSSLRSSHRRRRWVSSPECSGGATKWMVLSALIISSALALVFLASAQLTSDFESLINSSRLASGEGRVPIWGDTLRLLKAYALFGSGLGTYGTAFLKYQTAVVELDFTHAHNDYLEFASELGAIGFSLFAALMIAIAGRAIRCVKRAQEWDVRLAALGCAGAIAAIGLHSLVDFNLYMPANALSLAWIAGIAAGVPVAPLARRSLPSGDVVKVAAIGLALLLVIGTPVQIIAERTAQEDSEQSTRPIGQLLDAVRKDAASPHRWADVAEAMQRAGRRDEAKTTMATALRAGPNIPPLLLRAATLYDAVGEQPLAVRQTAHLLSLTGAYDAAVFDWYVQRGMSSADVLARGLPDSARATEAFIRYLMRPESCADVVPAWNVLVARARPDQQLAIDYVNFMSEQCRRNDAAARGWAQYLGSAANGYQQSDWVVNGDFESDASPLVFDWRIRGLNRDVEAALDDGLARTGSRSLRIRFAGRKNVDYSATGQTAYLPPGAYRFEAFVRTRAITTSEGIRFRIFDPDAPRRLDVLTDQVGGTSGWTRIEAMVRVPHETALVRINVVRLPAHVADDDIAGDISGTAWIDSVSLSSIE
ncbi:MAG: hypothetical protein DMF90_18930 [Acidobacteria bacterium]|nr:MAG: hypothetical protein DMF90_18930 [Acidobacteriota bacterium]